MKYIELTKALFKSQSNLNIHFLESLDIAPKLDKELRIKVSSENIEFIKKSFSELMSSMHYKKIYIMEDKYKVHYIFFKVGKQNIDEYVVIGPYLISVINSEEIKKISSINNSLDDKFEYLKSYYSSLPIMSEMTILESVSVILKYIYEDSDEYKIEYYSGIFKSKEVNIFSEEDIVSDMETLELRYEYENALLRDISQGNFKNATDSFSKLLNILPSSEYSTSIDNYKTSMTIVNVLLRKAIEKVGVHPYFINKLSRKIAEKIEVAKDKLELKNLIFEMTKEYCELVNSFRVEPSYSPIVKNAIYYINSHISSDINLSEISKLLNINKNYLSSLFKKETGLTITKYYMNMKMQRAKELIETTNLLVSDISELVGIHDASYFTKLYKKTFKTTPTEYKLLIKEYLN